MLLTKRLEVGNKLMKNKKLVIVGTVVALLIIGVIVGLSGVLEQRDLADNMNTDIPVVGSKQPAVKSVTKDLESRGFSTDYLSTSWSSDGKLLDDTTVTDKTSGTVYPAYVLTDIVDENNANFIYVNNGEVYAKTNCVVGNSEAPVVLSEHDYVVSYDPETNTYKNVVPSVDELIVKKVDHITKEYLASFSCESLNK